MDPVLSAFDTQLRRATGPTDDGGRVDRSGRVLRRVSAVPGGWNGIEWSDVDGAVADAVIAEQIAYFTKRATPFEWKYYDYDRPADLPDRLRAAGFAAGEEESLLVAAVTGTPLDVPPPAGVELRVADSGADLALVRRVHDEVFGGDHSAMVDGIRAQLRAHPGTVTPVLAVADGEAVCASRVEFHNGTDFASLWGGGTLPGWRGRGIYRAMVSHRARLAAERGFTHLRTDALPASRPILERLGFRRLATTVPFTFTPPA